MQNGAGLKIALATQGTRGDFQPMLSLAICFRKHGHTVKIYANPDHCKTGEAYGLDVVESCVEVKDVLDTEDGRKAMESGDLAVAVSAFAVQADDGPDYNKIFSDSVHEFQPHVLMYTGLIGDRVTAYLSTYPEDRTPTLSCSYQPQVLPTESFGPIVMYRVQLEPDQPIVHKWNMWFQFEARNRWEILEAAKAEGAPQDVLDNLDGPEGVWLDTFCSEEYMCEPKILAYSPAFWAAPSDWPKTDMLKITGQWRFTKEDQEEQSKKGMGFVGGPEMQTCADFIKAGRTPIYVGWGSMTVYSKEHMAILAVESLMKVGERGIIVAGWAGMDTGSLNSSPNAEALKEYCKDNIIFLKAAPHEWLFPQCAVCVHHGGIGTTQASLGAGTPTVVTPVFADQHDIAKHITAEGWGQGTCLLSKLDSDELAAKIKVCIGNQPMKDKVMALSAKIQQEDGVTSTVECVVKWHRDDVATGKIDQAREKRKQAILELRAKLKKKSIEQIISFFDSRTSEKWPQLKKYREVQMEVFSKLAALAASKKLWVVCASSSLARATEKLKSEEKGRFQEFAMLEELELKGNRLLAKLLKGIGPEQGWVSLQANNVDLVKRIDMREIGAVMAAQIGKQFADIMGTTSTVAKPAVK